MSFVGVGVKDKGISCSELSRSQWDERQEVGWMW